MSLSQSSREVAVLTAFRDPTGIERTKGEVFTVAYATERQREKVNALIYRGFLTFEVEVAQSLLAEVEPVEMKVPKQKRRRTTS